jgi:parvulin-like peptidyl-prolyl isomerase
LGEVLEKLEQIPFGVVGGELVSLSRALQLLKLDFHETSRPVAAWTMYVVERVVIRQEASELGLEPPDEEVQEQMREFRKARNLYAAADTERFLQRRGCSVDEFYEAMELAWLEGALRVRYADQPAERYFLQHTADYNSAVLSELVVADEEVARELLLQIRDEDEDFASLARRYSTAASRGNAGFIGEVRRGSLSAQESAAVFGAAADEVVGPFPCQRQFRLLRVHEVRRAVFTDAVRGEIVEQLWSEWLFRRVRAAQPEITLLAELTP